jgi:acyl-CoA synthetase (AMP-forming)/AMP-acid ligase II
VCLDRICEQFADSDALISRHQGLRYTYGQLKQEVENAARGLMWIGVEKGERVGVWSPNRAEWLIAQYALAKVGAIMVNINPAYRIRELEHALTQSGVSVIVAGSVSRAVHQWLSSKNSNRQKLSGNLFRNASQIVRSAQARSVFNGRATSRRRSGVETRLNYVLPKYDDAVT